jgi:hypothetical protein
MKRSQLFLAAGLLITALAATTTMLRSTSAAAPGPSASGHGTILLQDTNGKTVRRQFTFSARIVNGTVKGNAIIHNPSFDPKYDAQFDITCLRIVGNRASFGGSVRKTSDPVFNDEFDAAFFTVFDNGEPGGGNDTISEIFFDNVVEPSACQFIGADDFPQIPIESGSVQVR